MYNYFFFALLLFGQTGLPAQSPATFDWLAAAKSPGKDQYTLTLLRVGPGGAHVLRWQPEQRDFSGKTTPAYPVLASFHAGGELSDSRPVPDFEPESGQIFRLAVAGGDKALFVGEKPHPDGGYGLFVRVYDLARGTWDGPAKAILHAGDARAPVFGNAWFARSPDGQHTCVYWADGRYGFSYALFDAGFRFVRHGVADWPQGLGRSALRRLFCANDGSLLLQLQTSGSGATALNVPAPPFAWRADGNPVWPAEDVTTLAPFSVVVLCLKDKSQVFDVFYPKIGKKFATSFEFAQKADGPVLCAGFAGDDAPDRAESYFIYQIDPKTMQAAFLQNAPLTPSLRKAFLSDKDAADKKPVPDLRLARLDWTADGRAWLLAERQDGARNPVELGQAALLRLDSTYRITAARPVDKFQRLSSVAQRYTVSVAACPGPKGWWALWNKGNYPSASLMLTDCKSSGEPEVHELAGGGRLVLALLPHTACAYDGKWYFVGESATGDRIGIGVLQRAAKQ